jgi:hypothetical protein
MASIQAVGRRKSEPAVRCVCRAGVLLAVALGGCSDPVSEPAGLGASPVGMSSWSRGASSSSPAASGDARLAPPAAADPEALAELLAATPRDAGAGTADGGTSLVGTDTGNPEPAVVPSADGGAAPLAAKVRRGRVELGETAVEPQLSSPAIERAARAQLYWPLVQRCRDREGKILPPDMVKLQFTIDAEGAIVSSSVVATPVETRFEDAAQCMRRELSAATFRAPAASRGVPSLITATVPSVD